MRSRILGAQRETPARLPSGIERLFFIERSEIEKYPAPWEPIPAGRTFYFKSFSLDTIPDSIKQKLLGFYDFLAFNNKRKDFFVHGKQHDFVSYNKLIRNSALSFIIEILDEMLGFWILLHFLYPRLAFLAADD